ncbi:MAG: hypothetical protein FWD32_02705, partial [Firmicutes bacterium]|nr:hypothetical protein [Bacillota bacterium]
MVDYHNDFLFNAQSVTHFKKYLKTTYGFKVHFAVWATKLNYQDIKNKHQIFVASVKNNEHYFCIEDIGNLTIEQVMAFK